MIANGAIVHEIKLGKLVTGTELKLLSHVGRSFTSLIQ